MKIAYPLTAFPHVLYEGDTLIREINCGLLGERHCISVSISLETLVVTLEFTSTPDNVAWINAAVGRHIPEIEEAVIKDLLKTRYKTFLEQYPRCWWALNRLFDWERQQEINRAIEAGNGGNYVYTLWEWADELEEKLAKLREDQKK